MEQLEGIKEFRIFLVYDSPWVIDMMTKGTNLEPGILIFHNKLFRFILYKLTGLTANIFVCNLT